MNRTYATYKSYSSSRRRHERILAGHTLRGAHAAEELELDCDRHRRARVRYRRKHGDLLSRQRGAIATLALHRSGQTRAAFGRQSECAADVHLVSELS